MATEESREVVWQLSSLYDFVVLAAVTFRTPKNVPNRDSVHDEPLLTPIVAPASDDPEQLLHDEPERALPPSA